jgi:hypothetical protein
MIRLDAGAGDAGSTLGYVLLVLDGFEVTPAEVVDDGRC